MNSLGKGSATAELNESSAVETSSSLDFAIIDFAITRAKMGTCLRYWEPGTLTTKDYLGYLMLAQRVSLLYFSKVAQ